MSSSEWITWERCPRCGSSAAVGWKAATDFVDPIEFDCPGGCHLGIDEMVRNFPARDCSDPPHDQFGC
ncbi:hypothetical protein [Modestobacter sp. SSW1-42]|uniref:hypothetical protein n=1 Tax=Modestobacter sp. SSW1-42 TaxID=596372 RepID=UPI003987E05C